MSLPRHLPAGYAGPAQGPVDDTAFRGALLGCVVLVLAGLPLTVVGGNDARPIAIALLVVGALGLVVGFGGLLAERLLQPRQLVLPPVAHPGLRRTRRRTKPRTRRRPGFEARVRRCDPRRIKGARIARRRTHRRRRTRRRR